MTETSAQPMPTSRRRAPKKPLMPPMSRKRPANQARAAMLLNGRVIISSPMVIENSPITSITHQYFAPARRSASLVASMSSPLGGHRDHPVRITLVPVEGAAGRLQDRSRSACTASRVCSASSATARGPGWTAASMGSPRVTRQ